MSLTEKEIKTTQEIRIQSSIGIEKARFQFRVDTINNYKWIPLEVHKKELQKARQEAEKDLNLRIAEKIKYLRKKFPDKGFIEMLEQLKTKKGDKDD